MIRQHGATGTKRTMAYMDQNRRAARAILEDPERHGGETAALVAWARGIMAAGERNAAAPTQARLPGLEVRNGR